LKINEEQGSYLLQGEMEKMELNIHKSKISINKLKRLLGINLLVVLLLPLAFSRDTNAMEVEYEIVAVSRIVGESPTELLRQLQPNIIDIQKATWYTYDLGGGKI